MYRFAARNDSPVGPYFEDVGIIALVPNAWGGPWQPRQQILTRLSQYCRVLWCNPPPLWTRIWQHPTRSDSQPIDLEGVSAPGFGVYYPDKWDFQIGWPELLRRSNLRSWLRPAREFLTKQGCRKIILYIWRPQYEPALDLIDHDLSCYHIDDEYTFSEVEMPIDEREVRLITRAGQVFIHSPALWEKKGKINPHTAYVPNGVDYTAYAEAQREPDDLGAIPHPRIGYVGFIKKQLDIPLLVTLATRHPKWSFVFVGPKTRAIDANPSFQQLTALPNVYLLGRKPVRALPAYTQHIDVCMLCYEVNDYTKFIYPLKLHEYLASGRPVVGAPIRALSDFAHVVTLASSPAEWSHGLEASLDAALCSSAWVRERQSVARCYDWNRLVHRIASTIFERLGSAYVNEFKRRFTGETTEPFLEEQKLSQNGCSSPSIPNFD